MGPSVAHVVRPPEHDPPGGHDTHFQFVGSVSVLLRYWSIVQSAGFFHPRSRQYAEPVTRSPLLSSTAPNPTGHLWHFRLGSRFWSWNQPVIRRKDMKKDLPGDLSDPWGHYQQYSQESRFEFFSGNSLSCNLDMFSSNLLTSLTIFWSLSSSLWFPDFINFDKIFKGFSI